MGARCLLDINLIWFGSIDRLSQWRGGRYFTCSNNFYLPSLRLEEGGGVSTLWIRITALRIRNTDTMLVYQKSKLYT